MKPFIILIFSFLFVNCTTLSHQERMMKDLQKPGRYVYIVAWCDYDYITVFKSEKDYVNFCTNHGKVEFKKPKIKNSDHEIFFTGDCLIELYPERP